MELTVKVHAEAGQFWADIPELPGCFPTGRTLTELHETVAEAVGSYLWDGPAALSTDALEVGESRITVTPA